MRRNCARPSAAETSLRLAPQRRNGADHDGAALVDAARAQPADRAGAVIVVGRDHAAFAADERAGLREVEDGAVAE